MEEKNNKKGIFAAIIASATFGMMPFLSKEMMNSGISIETIISYRYFLASCILFCWLLYKKCSFRISGKQLVEILFLGACYPAVTSLLMFSYEYLSTGISTSLHFLYPIPVALLMILIFKEKLSFSIFFAIIVSICGVLVLGISGDIYLSTLGVILVLLADIIYAIYIILLNKLSVRKMSGILFTFYILLTASFYSLIGGVVQGNLQWITDKYSLSLSLFLALFSTVISNIALVESVKKIGSTLTAIFGTMEPLIAVIIGIFLYHEPFSFHIAIGMFLIFSAVIVIIISNESKRTNRGRIFYQNISRIWKNKIFQK